MDDATTYISADALSALAGQIFTQAGLRPQDAAVIGQDLVAANLRGIDSHGVSRIPMYLERLAKGVVKPQPDITYQTITPAVGLVDGDDGMGFLAAHRAMDEAIALAEGVGIGLVGVRRSTHFGMAALYVQQAIERGFIALACTNSSPAIPVWGGRTAFLGASPFAAGVPGGTKGDYVLDMAMTVIARGKIRLAATHGTPIPLGLALDSDGAPTTDAAKAFEGVCLPFGGVKGAAMSMLMELLSGVLTGANYAGRVKSLYFDHSEPQNVGHLFFAIKRDLFVSAETFDERMDDVIDRVKALPRAQGFDEILMPGEPETRMAEQRARTGIALSQKVREQLEAEAARLDVPFPSMSPHPLDTAA